MSCFSLLFKYIDTANVVTFFFYFLKRSNVSNQRDHGATLRLVVGGGVVGWGHR